MIFDQYGKPIEPERPKVVEETQHRFGFFRVPLEYFIKGIGAMDVGQKFPTRLYDISSGGNNKGAQHE